MYHQLNQHVERVHCHVGSLEIDDLKGEALIAVHCHVGSLEKCNPYGKQRRLVHCHVGSLEIIIK